MINKRRFVLGMIWGGVILASVLGMKVIYPLGDQKVYATLNGCGDDECNGIPSPIPQVVFTLDLGKDGPNCGQNHFHVNAALKKDGVPQSGIEVEFSYKATTEKKTTNANGEAGNDMEFKGNDTVTAKAIGYPTQTVGVDSSAKDNCEPIGGSEEVLGAATEPVGEVLGLATTGAGIEDLLTLGFSLGAGLIGVGIKLIPKKRA